MNDNVIPGNFTTRLDIPPENVIAGAAKETFSRVLVVGTSGEYSLYFACSESNVAETILMLERAKKFLMDQIK